MSDKLSIDEIEKHDVIKPMTSNWKLLNIIMAFVNRVIMEKSRISRNIDIIEKKPDILEYIPEPIIRKYPFLDNEQFDTFRVIHKSFDHDLCFLTQCQNEQPIKHEETTVQLDTNKQAIMDDVLCGLVSINEYIFSFVSYYRDDISCPKVMKAIEYFFTQRKQYLSIISEQLSQST